MTLKAGTGAAEAGSMFNQDIFLKLGHAMSETDLKSGAGVAEAGWTPDQVEAPHYSLLIDRAVQPATPENLQRFMERAWRALHSLDDSWPFREPVDGEDVPDYYDIVKVWAPPPLVANCAVACGLARCWSA